MGLTRIATPETEAGLIPWARGVSCGAIRRKGELRVQSLRDTRDAERERRLGWWDSDDGKRFCLEAEFPAAAGAVVASALQRAAESSPSCREKRVRAGSR